MNPLPLLKRIAKRIEWSMVISTFFILTLICLLLANTVVDSPGFLLGSLGGFVIMVLVVIVSIAIDEFRDRKKFRS